MNYDMFMQLLNEFCEDCNVTDKNAVIISEFNDSKVILIWVDSQGKTHKRIYDYNENEKITIESEMLRLPW